MTSNDLKLTSKDSNENDKSVFKKGKSKNNLKVAIRNIIILNEVLLSNKILYLLKWLSL